MTTACWLRAGVAWATLGLALAGTGSAGEPTCGPPLDGTLRESFALLEQEVRLALMLQARGEAYPSETLRAAVRGFEREARRGDRHQRRAAPQALQGLRAPLSGLGIDGVVGGPASAPDAYATGTGSIAGTVRDAATGLPVAGAAVSLYRTACNSSTGSLTAYATTDAAGAYSTTATLEAGQYFLTADAPGHVGTIFGGLACVGRYCGREDALRTGTPVTVGTASTDGVDFTLAPLVGGRITGNVTSTSSATPLVNGALVHAIDVATGRAGNYGVALPGVPYEIVDLLPGSYVVAAYVSSRSHVGRVYGGEECGAGGCDFSKGTVVTVIAGATTPGIDLALQPAGSVSGVVTPADDAYVEIYDATGRWVDDSYGSVLPTGEYTVTGLASGTYYARARSELKYVNQRWGGPPCTDSRCDPLLGRSFSVTSGLTTSGVDFSLSPGGSMSGSLAGDVEGLSIYDANGSAITYAYADAVGSSYVTPAVLPSGSYRVVAHGSGKASVAYGRCASCSPLDGTPVPVTQGSVTTGIDFGPLPTGSLLSGTTTLLDATPVYSGLDIYSSTGIRVSGGGRGSTCGTWEASEPLVAGTYFLKIRGRTGLRDYRGQLYGGKDCELSCDVTSGTPITVDGTTNRTDIDFSLVPWVRPGDTNLDKRADILWRHSGGALYVWLMNGTALSGSTFLPPISTNWVVKALADFNGDQKADIVWRETGGGSTYIWFMDGGRSIGQAFTSSSADNSWTIEGTGDFDGDGKQDILWRHSGGALYVWLMQGATLKPASAYLPAISLQWVVKGIGDFNGDGKADILWRDANSGATYLWLMNGASAIGAGYTTSAADNTWTISGVGDMDGDGTSDVLWRHSGGAMYVWLMQGTKVGAGSAFLPPITTNWLIQGLRDFDGDGRADVLWREQTAGTTYLWLMNGASATGVGYTAAQADNSWSIQGQ